MGQQTLWSEEVLASLSQSQEDGRAWMASLASCSSLSELAQKLDPSGLCGRTFRVRSLSEMGPSGNFSESFSTSGIVTSRGECLMLNSSEWHSAAAASFLSDILERGGICGGTI